MSHLTNKFATLSLLHFLHTTTSESVIRLHSLTHLELLTLTTLYTNHTNTFQIEVVKSALTNKSDFTLLSLKDISIIHKIVLDKSILPPKDFTLIYETLSLQEDKKYSTPDFTSCQICQEKGLDKVRNCPLLGKDTYSKSVKYVINNSKVVTECPTYTLNNAPYMSSVFELLNMLILGFLPLKGGLMEQTPFVYEVSKLLKDIIEKRKALMSPMLM